MRKFLGRILWNLIEPEMCNALQNAEEEADANRAAPRNGFWVSDPTP